MSGVVALLKEGKGYGFDEISYHEKRDSFEMFSVVSGAEGDLSSENAIYKQIVQSDDASESPVCYAEGNYAYEEYSDKTYVYNIKDVGKTLIKEIADNIYHYASVSSEMFEGNCSYSYKQDGAITVVKLSYVRERHDDIEGTSGFESKQNFTEQFAFFDGRLLGFQYIVDTKVGNEGDVTYFGFDGTCSVIVGVNPFTMPKREDCTEQEDYIPSWTKGSNFPRLST